MSERPFPRTATKVDYWCRKDNPTIGLNPDEFTVNDVWSGDVMGFYYDHGNHNECSITGEKPNRGYGAMFIGNQDNPSGLRWYDKHTLTNTIKHGHQYDPDTRVWWGDFGNYDGLRNREIQQYFRYVLPMSALHRWYWGGYSDFMLDQLYRQMRDHTGIYRLPPP